MKKLRSYLERWIEGQKVKNINASLIDMQECLRIYNAISNNEKPSFINGRVKEILDSCSIRSVKEGIGWRIV